MCGNICLVLFVHRNLKKNLEETFKNLKNQKKLKNLKT